MILFLRGIYFPCRVINVIRYFLSVSFFVHLNVIMVYSGTFNHININYYGQVRNSGDNNCRDIYCSYSPFGNVYQENAKKGQEIILHKTRKVSTVGRRISYWQLHGGRNIVSPFFIKITSCGTYMFGMGRKFIVYLGFHTN